MRAKGRGVDVRLIADKTTPCPATNGIEPLAAAGVPIWIDAQARIAHAKTMVIDGEVWLTLRRQPAMLFWPRIRRHRIRQCRSGFYTVGARPPVEDSTFRDHPETGD